MNSHMSHTKAIRAQLLASMRTGEYARCERLPRESVLCVKLGISRTQLRDILASLEREGFIRTAEGPADEKTAAQLRIPVGTPVLRVSRLCTADGRPAIYCEDVLEKALVRGDYTEEDLKLPIFHFLQEICGVYPYLDLTDLRAVPADEALAGLLQVPLGAPLLYMEEVDYDIDGKPVFCSAEYFADGMFRHTVMRKKL